MIDFYHPPPKVEGGMIIPTSTNNPVYMIIIIILIIIIIITIIRFIIVIFELGSNFSNVFFSSNIMIFWNFRLPQFFHVFEYNLANRGKRSNLRRGP